MALDTTAVSSKSIPKWGKTTSSASRIGTAMSDELIFPNRIREFREARKWSASHLGKMIGMAGPTVTRLETGERRLKLDQAQKFAETFGVGVADLTDGKAILPPAPAASPPPANARIAQPVEVPALGAMRRDLPIYGTAAGSDGDGAFILNAGDVVDRAYRPPSLTGNTKAYGLYVEGDSMAPAYAHGAFVVADPTKKPRPGDNVVVVIVHGDNEHAEQMAYVKEFVKQTATELHLRQHNPPAILVFSRSRVVHESMHRLLTLAELMGVG